MYQALLAVGPNDKWDAYITYIPTEEDWFYLIAVVDIFSREVVGWAIGATMHSDLVKRVLPAASTTRQPQPDMHHHSVRGSQYASHDYRARMKATQIQISTSRTCIC